MALVIEDGTGKTNSNTYVLEADLVAYAALRNVTIAATAGANSEALLITAMDYLESLSFIGYKYTDAQALQWPRGKADVDGYDIGVDEIPQLLKDAQMEYAIGVDGGNNPLANQERETKREKVGDIEVEYTSGAYSQTYLRAAAAKVAKLVKSSTMVHRA